MEKYKQIKHNDENSSGNPTGILFTCIGRRVTLLNCFRRSASRLNFNARFLGTDITELSPALQLCDAGFIVAPVTEPDYIEQLLEIVKNNNVRLLVPTTDLDLKILSQNKAAFARLGCSVLVSEPEVIDICRDKRQSYKFLLENGFDVPVTTSPAAALENADTAWPCFVKPWDGYAGLSTAVANNREELAFYAKKIHNAICQEFISGDEITCDIYVDFTGSIRCVVPRQRLEVRCGEVSKSRIRKDTQIMNLSMELIQTLAAGPGVVTVQLFRTTADKIVFTEINPRFGGGVPLSIRAGADFPKWILEELQGRKPDIRFDGFTDGMVMLRYDSEVWIEKNKNVQSASEGHQG